MTAALLDHLWQSTLVAALAALLALSLRNNSPRVRFWLWFTASAQYFRALGGEQSIAMTAAWGLKQLSDGNNLNAAVLEATYKPNDPWSVFARGEWVENAELGAHHAVNRVGQLSIGAVHDWRLSENWKFGVGASHSFAFAPAALGYGGMPGGNMIFTRLIAE